MTILQLDNEDLSQVHSVNNSGPIPYSEMQERMIWMQMSDRIVIEGQLEKETGNLLYLKIGSVSN
jgi:hypothetical protein